MEVRKGTTLFLYTLLAFILFFFISTHSANVDYDSPGYIHFGPIRPLIYPYFIWLFHGLGQYQFSAIVWTQALFLIASLIYARYWLLKNLHLSEFAIFLIFLCVITTISLHYQVWYIQSEGLTFPLFILTFFKLIECFQKFDLKKLGYLALLCNVLILTRLQFYYLYVVFFILGIWYVWQGVAFRQLARCVALFLGSMVLTILIDHSYHYFKHGVFKPPSYEQYLLMSQTLFLANNDAANYFLDNKIKMDVQNLINLRNAQNLNQDAALISNLSPSNFDYAYQSYVKHFQGFQGIFSNVFQMNETAINLDFIKEAILINKILFKHNLKSNLYFMIWKFIKCMGGISLFLFHTILMIAILFIIIKNKIKQPEIPLLFVATIVMTTFLNAAIIAVCNTDLPPYFCYSQFMFYCLAAFIANLTFKELKSL